MQPQFCACYANRIQLKIESDATSLAERRSSGSPTGGRTAAIDREAANAVLANADFARTALGRPAHPPPTLPRALDASAAGTAVPYTALLDTLRAVEAHSKAQVEAAGRSQQAAQSQRAVGTGLSARRAGIRAVLTPRLSIALRSADLCAVARESGR